MSVEETRTTRVSDEPQVVHTTEVRDGSSAAWWIGAIVAIVAILAVVFLVTREPSTTDLENAMEQGRLTGALESTQSGMSSAAQAAQDAADRAAQAAADAASATAGAADNTVDRIDATVDINPPVIEVEP